MNRAEISSLWLIALMVGSLVIAYKVPNII
jgi:hypothetical protein